MAGGITNAIDMNLGKLQEMVRDREARRAQSTGSQRAGHDWVTEQHGIQKDVLMSLSAGQQWRHRQRQTDRHGAGQRKKAEHVESKMETYTLPYVKQPMGICCVAQGIQTCAL